ncbi:Ethylene-overproduction protein 1 [Asimina triloba]
MDDHKEEEAIAELTKAIEFRPDLQLLHLRAAFYDSMGNAAATLRDCEAALCLDPNHPDTHDLYNKSWAQEFPDAEWQSPRNSTEIDRCRRAPKLFDKITDATVR